MAFADLGAELTGLLPGLPAFLAQTYIKRAWRKIRDRRNWSFKSQDAVVICPAQVTTGTFAITQFSSTVVSDVAAGTALTATVPFAQPGLTKMQIRFMGLAQTGQIYSITAFQLNTPGAGQLTLTLDRVVQEATNALSPYLSYRCYITPPDTNFSRWDSLNDMINAIGISGDRLSYSSVYFDLRDPQRQALGQAYYCGLYKAAGTVPLQATQAATAPVYELWPHPTMGQTFYTRYLSTGVDFTLPTDQQPAIIPDQLIVHAALTFDAYPWAKANAAHFPALKGVNFAQLISETAQFYQSELIDAMRQDDELALQRVYNRGHGLKPDRPVGFYGPIDSNYIQAHAVTW